MAGIQKIVESINNVIDKIRIPVIPIPAILLICSVFRRPGLSAMIIAAKTIRRQSEFGAPTGALPDGTPNKMNALIYRIVREMNKEAREYGVTESVIQPGAISVAGTVATPMGPGTFVGTNTTPVKAYGTQR
jgi:hypothetical protein